MNDAFLVRRLEGLRQFRHERQRLIDRYRTFSKALGQGLALDELHY